MDFNGMYLITIGFAIAVLIGSHIAAAWLTGSKRFFSIFAFASLLIGAIGWTAGVYLSSNSDSANFAGSNIVLMAEVLTAPGLLVGAFVFAIMIAFSFGRRKEAASSKGETIAERKAREARDDDGSAHPGIDAGFPRSSSLQD